MRRRLLLLVLLLLLLAGPAPAATLFVQATVPGNFNGSVDATSAFGSNVTAGNAIVVWVVWTDDGATVSSIVDTLTHTYIGVDNPTTCGTGRAAFFYVLNTAGGADTITVTLSGAQYGFVVAHEISGVALASALDQHLINCRSNPGTGTNAIATDAVVTTTAGQYLLGAAGELSFGTPSLSTGTGYTVRAAADDNGISGLTEDQIQVAGGSITATFTSSIGTADFPVGILTLKAAGGAVGAPRLLLLGVGP